MPKGVYKRIKSFSQEARKKMSEAKKGKALSEEHRKKLSLAKIGKTSPRKGIILSKKTKEKMSEVHKGKKHSLKTRRKMSLCKRGERGYWWKGGINKENNKIRNGIEIRLWREAVFARDNWTCQECSKRGETLNAHHIFSFKDYLKLRTSIENGITLCLKCHKKVHFNNINQFKALIN